MPESYTVGYDTAVMSWFNKRRAHSHAKFFTPYLQRGMRLLDGGCGVGSITADLATIVAPGETIGIDLEQSQINHAHHHTTHLSNLRFAQANITQLPYPDDYFDAVFVHGVLEHLAHPLAAVLEIKRVLKPGGIVGARHADWDGFLLAPIYPSLQPFLPTIKQLLKAQACDPQFGRHQVQYFNQAGLSLEQVSASYDCWTANETERIEAGAFFAAYCASEGFKQQVYDAQLLDPTTLSAMIAGFQQWRDDPNAFAADAWSEVVARKI